MPRKPQPITEPLNNTRLVKVVAADLDITIADAQRNVTAVLDAVSRAVCAGHNVTITNFGTWIAYRTTRRTARNPQTGDVVTLTRHPAVKWRPSPALAAAVRGGRKTFTIHKRPKGSAR
jgi:nucleoid DNA-binding protein